MGFYDLDKAQRTQRVDEINAAIHIDMQRATVARIKSFFSDQDTYIRKAAYQAFGKFAHENPEHRSRSLTVLEALLAADDEKIRQSAINAAGEIGIKAFDEVSRFFDRALFDDHHIVRNAVIGSIKKMSEKNPVPVLAWARSYLHHPDQEIRREICHGIELRGRTHPQDILPLLIELQFNKSARVRTTLVHVLGQIAYKKNCLAEVVRHLKRWGNQAIVTKALQEIISVHDRYKDFAALSRQQAIEYIDEHYWQRAKGESQTGEECQ